MSYILIIIIFLIIIFLIIQKPEQMSNKTIKKIVKNKDMFNPIKKYNKTKNKICGNTNCMDVVDYHKLVKLYNTGNQFNISTIENLLNSEMYI